MRIRSPARFEHGIFGLDPETDFGKTFGSSNWEASTLTKLKSCSTLKRGDKANVRTRERVGRENICYMRIQW